MEKRTCVIVSIFVCVIVATLVAMPYFATCDTAMHYEYATVVIDAGHGGKDGGVVGYDGTLEADINLAIANRLQRMLRGKGMSVVMTRTSRDALGSTKKEDMQKRAELINASHPDMLVSIHVNKYSDSRRRGVQIFYDDTGRWQREAILMQNVMNEYINKKYAGRGDLMALGGDYFITKCAKVPSLIVETGFISNSEDFTLLKSHGYQEDIAKNIAISIESILSMS